MPFRNRVTPFGQIVALPGRGLVMGNRGILHDDERRLVREAQVRRWIACRTEFKGIRRTIMRPHSYTELFFLDEATALGAGHRPCGECRRDAYRQFCALWEACFGAPVSADIIDAKLQAERRDRRTKRTYRADLAGLPDGTYVAIAGRAWLVWAAHLYAWSDARYATRCPRPSHAEVDVLTPRSTVEILTAGYRPDVHPSLDAIADSAI